MGRKSTILAIVLYSSFGAVAQDGAAPAAIYKSGDEITEELAKAGTEVSAAGVAITVAPGISIRSRSSAADNFAVMHPYSIEIYHIMAGSGTFVTGGRLVLPLADSPSDDVLRTEHGIEGGVAQQVKAGDVLVLQPGTPHWFMTIDGEAITYMESRVRVASHPIRFQ